MGGPRFGHCCLFNAAPVDLKCLVLISREPAAEEDSLVSHRRLPWRDVCHGCCCLAIAPACAGLLSKQDESGLSGSLNLGHYGVSQSNAFESVAVNTNGAELITPFAKLQV